MTGPETPADHIPAVLFVGGGTGGHIFPNLAILERLADRLGVPTAGIPHRFIISDRAVDAGIAKEQGFPFVASPAKPFGLRPRTFLRFLNHWGKSVRAARAAIRELKGLNRPVVMVATGGFVSAPSIQAARAERIPVVMVNLDAVPGRANRWAARHAARVLTAAPIASGPGSTWEQIPPLVREAARPPADQAGCRRLLGLDPARPVLLVTGASLGARSINQLMAQLATSQTAAFTARGWQVLHQTGDSDVEACTNAYRDAGVPAIVAPFVRGMGAWWGAADLAVGRCGAGIVAEAWANGVPALFLPYPYHKDQHQKANAMPLVRAGAAEVFTDRLDPAANARDVGVRLVELLTQPERLADMRKNCASLGPADGADRAADAVLGAANAVKSR